MSTLQSHCRAKHWRRALAAEDFSELPGAEAVSRREDRYPHARILDILRTNPVSANWGFSAVELLDCSLSGIGFLNTEPMEVGDEFLVKLCIGALSLIRYRVQHCVRISDGRYRIGAEFVAVDVAPERCCPSGEAILDALLGSD